MTTLPTSKVCTRCHRRPARTPTFSVDNPPTPQAFVDLIRRLPEERQPTFALALLPAIARLIERSLPTTDNVEAN
jgi:hypothetical protein